MWSYLLEPYEAWCGRICSSTLLSPLEKNEHTLGLVARLKMAHIRTSPINRTCNHVVLPYIDVFNTYIVTRAYNTHLPQILFILLPRNLQKLIPHPNLHLKLTPGFFFFQSQCPLALKLEIPRRLTGL